MGRGKKFIIPLGSIIEEDMGYCTYVGSLTTPPCSEGVTFMLSQHISFVTKRQVAEYRLTAGVGIDGNNRPIRPQIAPRGRTVVRLNISFPHSPECADKTSQGHLGGFF